MNVAQGFPTACSMLLLAAMTCAAAEPPSKRFPDHLDAGEFGPALAIAQQAADAQQRDGLLEQVAAAQSRAGSRRAALATASMIESDPARNAAVTGAARAPAERFGLGGGPQPDFDALIDLITSTVAPTSWEDVGGPGSIAPFPGGVWVDAQGAMHRLEENDTTGRLSRLRDRAADRSPDSAVRGAVELRKVSLPRLERAVQLRLAAGEPLDEEMHYLAGLHKIQYVLLYPETRDIVLAGPADDWRQDAEGRMVAASSGRPVLQLDDLVVLLRHMQRSDATFGCSITPVPESLARTKTFLEDSSRTPLKPGGRDAWLKKVRDSLGEQDIEYFGIDPQTRVAQVLVEADYRMKLVGIGLEDGVLGVPSYLASLPANQDPPPLGVLRWWFTLKYDALSTNAARDAYQLSGQSVQVLSENELLDAMGQRVHTGESEPLNREFARNFTQQFPALAQKYPVYAELANLFDLAMCCALMQAEQIPQRASWQPTCFLDPRQYEVATGAAPRRVQSVVNHRMLNRSRFVAAVSGGVQFDASQLVRPEAIIKDKSGTLVSRRAASAPESRTSDLWWWD